MSLTGSIDSLANVDQTTHKLRYMRWHACLNIEQACFTHLQSLILPRIRPAQIENPGPS